MDHSPESKDTLESLGKEFRRMRLVFGITLIVMSLILTLTLPSVIRNAVFRVSHQPETKGLLTQIVEIIRGEPVVYVEDVPDDAAEQAELSPEASPAE